MSLHLLDDYAPLTEVAADLKVHPRTVRRRINQPDGWPCLEWAGMLWLHVPTIRQIIRAETRSRNPRRRNREPHAAVWVASPAGEK